MLKIYHALKDSGISDDNMVILNTDNLELSIDQMFKFIGLEMESKYFDFSDDDRGMSDISKDWNEAKIDNFLYHWHKKLLNLQK